jgi:hypothetical protein
MVALETLGDSPDKPPIESGCHWRERLGNLVVGRDLWWEIRAEPHPDPDALESLTNEVTDALTRIALPAIEAHSTDEVMLEDALARDGKGYRQLDVAGALLRAIGGTAEQQQRFRTLVNDAQRFMLTWDRVDLRPAQGPKRAAANLVRLRDPRPSGRADAAHLLGRASPAPQLVTALREALGDEESEVRSRAATSLAELGDVPSLERLLDVLDAERDRFRAVDLGWALSDLALRSPEVMPHVVSALRGRYDRALGLDLAGFGATLERLGAR